ncbi:MAG: C45 family peptidase [Candidatus Bathyarchaeia archaeon]
MSYVPVVLSGSPRKVGRQRGKAFHELLLAIAEVTLTEKARAELLETAEHLERVLEKTYPGLLEELRGMAETSGLGYDDVLLLNAWWDRPTAPSLGGCSNVSLTNSEVGPILGSTLDIGRAVGRVMTVIKPRRGYAFADVGCRAHMLGTARAINERGLCVSSSSVPTTDRSWGFPWYIFHRVAVQYCSTVDEAIDLLLSLKPGIANAGRIIFLDERGNTAVGDVSPTNRVIIGDEDGGLVTTNFFTAEGMKKFDAGNEKLKADSRARYERMMNFVRSTDRSHAFEEMVNLLRSHGEGGLCQHASPEVLEAHTANISLPERREMHVSQPIGPYCRSRFIRYRFF